MKELKLKYFVNRGVSEWGNLVHSHDSSLVHPSVSSVTDYHNPTCINFHQDYSSRTLMEQFRHNIDNDNGVLSKELKMKWTQGNLSNGIKFCKIINNNNNIKRK